MTQEALEFKHIADYNSITFLQDVQEAIRAGYKVELSNRGAPELNGALKTIILVKGDLDVGIVQEDPKSNTLVIEDYDGMNFMLAFAEATALGFDVNPKHVSLTPHGLKWVALERAVSVSTPDPVVTHQEDAKDAAEAPTEPSEGGAEEPKAKPRRKSKQTQ